MNTTSPPDWTSIILQDRGPREIWESIFSTLQEIATRQASPITLHDATVTPDRLLAEAAWELWASYLAHAPKTSDALKAWTNQGSGKTVLIIDALSLREMPLFIAAAEERNIAPSQIKITGSESPSTTDQFAESIGTLSRANLANNKKLKSFALFGGNCRTDVVSLPFEDCPVPPEPNLVIWHTWLDDLLHVQKKAPDVVTKFAESAFQSDGFWSFVNKLRQGRSLVITSDHGYAVSKFFSSEETDPDAVEILRTAFGASRYVKSSAVWAKQFMPPLVVEHNQYHVIMGQRKWKVAGGFPHICHGGLSLLEVAVPWMEYPAL